MATSSGPKVVGLVSEADNTVSVGVVHDGQFLPVASAALDYAKARNLSAKGEAEDASDDEGGEA